MPSEKRIKISNVLALIMGTLLLLPGISFLIAAIITATGGQSVKGVNAIGGIIGSVIFLLLSQVLLGAFFLRKSKRGPGLLKASGWILSFYGLMIPFSLAMPIGATCMVLMFSLSGIWILCSTMMLPQNLATPK